MACMTCASEAAGCGAGCSCSSLTPARSKTVASKICSKCKDGVSAVALGNHTEPMCGNCLYLSLFSKFKTTVNNHGLIKSSDSVLVAVSGGPASRLVVEMLKDMQTKQRNDAEAAKESTIKVFTIGAVYVEESVVLNLPSSESQAARDAIEEIYSDVLFHVIQLEAVYGCSDLARSKHTLSKLFDSIKDSTGREDMLEIIRMQAIQQVAQKHKYTKVVLGLTATRIAARIIAATTKGQGYSLPASIQYIDRRWAVPVVVPLHDCVAREVALHCHISKLSTYFVKGLSTMASPRSSLNNLAHHFISLLQEDNPSREHTIVRTAAKLTAFSFNAEEVPPSRRRRNPQKDQLIDRNPRTEETLCSICKAPVDCSHPIRRNTPQPQSSASNGTHAAESVHMKASCCSSCLFPNPSRGRTRGS